MQESVYDEVVERLVKAYKSVKIGDPSEPGVLCGPLHTKQSVENFKKVRQERSARPLHRRAGCTTRAERDLVTPLADPCCPHTLHPQGIEDAKAQGGKIAVGGEVIEGPGNFVQPTIIESTHDMEVVNTELFAPILHICKVKVSVFQSRLHISRYGSFHCVRCSSRDVRLLTSCSPHPPTRTLRRRCA